METQESTADTTESTIKKFREKLAENGQSLKFWHKKYASEICRYDYFIRQINNIELIRDDVVRIISNYCCK